MTGALTVHAECEVLQVSPSGYYHWKASQGRDSDGLRRTVSDEAVLAYLRASHVQIGGEYGWPRMHKELLARGVRVGKERVRLLMQHHGNKAQGKRSLGAAGGAASIRRLMFARTPIWRGGLKSSGALCRGIRRLDDGVELRRVTPLLAWAVA